MERDMSQSTALCRSGCGFYGNPATDGLCSKCFKDAVMRKQAVPASATASSASSAVALAAVGQSSSCPSPSLPKKPPTPLIEADLATATTTVPLPCPAQSTLNEASSSQTDPSEGVGKLAGEEVSICGEVKVGDAPKPEAKKKAKNRCDTCKVKVGVLGFPCRCGGNFCSTHRYANEHNCTFDYKTHGQNEIRENNPKVLGEKIQKI